MHPQIPGALQQIEKFDSLCNFQQGPDFGLRYDVDLLCVTWDFLNVLNNIIMLNNMTEGLSLQIVAWPAGGPLPASVPTG